MRPAVVRPQAIDLAKDFKIPGGDMPGIYYLRDVVDADKLVAAIQELKKTDGKASAGPTGTQPCLCVVDSTIVMLADTPVGRLPVKFWRAVLQPTCIRRSIPSAASACF